MSAPIDHKKPTAAFVLLFVIVSAILGNGLRARADGTSVSLAFPTTIFAETAVPATDPAQPTSEAAATVHGLPPGTRAGTPSTAAAAGPRPGNRAMAHGQRYSGQVLRSRARGQLGHEGTSVGRMPGPQDPRRVAVRPGTGSLASINTGLHRPTPRAAGVPVRVSLRSGGVKVAVGVGGLRSRVRLSLRDLAGRR